MAVFFSRRSDVSFSSLVTACALAVVALGACASSQDEAPPPQYPQQGQYPQQYPPGQQPPAQGQYPQQQYPQQQYPQQPPAQGQYPQQQYPQQPPAQGQYPQQPPTAPPPALPPAGGVLPAPASGPAAVAIDPSAAAAVQPILTELARAKAPPGAKPLGSVMAANFQQGQQLEAQVQMEPGRCYTVVGAGLPPGVTELDIKLVAITPMAGMAPILAVDNTTGAQSVVGERPNCFKWAWPLPAPVKVVITMTGGAGLAAAQLFVQ